MATLRVISGPAAGTSLDIEREVTVGRESTDLEIPDTELSRQHAALRAVPDGVEVEDLGSLNGTYVNGERIAGPVTLAASGTVRLGASELTIEVATQAPGPLGAPDVTKARAVVSEGPEVTRARDVVPGTPDVTKVRPTASGPDEPGSPPSPPDVTAVRPTSPSPDATTVRPTPPPTAEQGPGASSGAPSAAGPGVTAGRPIPPPAPPVEAAGTDAGRRRWPLMTAAALITLGVVAVVLLLLLS